MKYIILINGIPSNAKSFSDAKAEYEKLEELPGIKELELVECRTVAKKDA